MVLLKGYTKLYRSILKKAFVSQYSSYITAIFSLVYHKSSSTVVAKNVIFPCKPVEN